MTTLIQNRLSDIQSLSPTNTHFDKQFDKTIKLDMNKEKQKLANLWSISYLLATVLASYADEMSDQYNTVGFHSGKVKSLLNKVDRSLDEYFKYTKKFLTLEKNGDDITEDYEILKRWVDSFSKLDEGRDANEIKSSFISRLKNNNYAAQGIINDFKRVHNLQVGHKYKVKVGADAPFEGFFKAITLHPISDNIFWLISFSKVKKDGTPSVYQHSTYIHRITNIQKL